MVFQRKLDCISNGYQIPVVPRVPRSAKGKRSSRKKIENKHMYAFDLLANLAGKILSEKEGLWAPSKAAGVFSTVYSDIQEQLDNERPFEGSVFDQGSCDESTSAFPTVPDDQISQTTKQHLKSLALIKCDTSENDASLKVFASAARGEPPCKVLCSTSGPLIYDDSTKIYTLADPIDLDGKTPVIVSSDSNIDVPPYGDCSKAPNSSFPLIRKCIELHVDRDDRENSSSCIDLRYIHPQAFKAQCTQRYRRKMIKSNHTKVDPISYNDGELSNYNVEMKPVFHSQTLFYTRQKNRRGSLGRRKIFDRCSMSTCCGRSRDEDILYSPVKNVNKLEATSDLLAARNGANNMSCTTRGQNSLNESEDHPVKLSIKSFNVPELFIEIPENATVGSLKRTVMKAVMAILGDGHVGVLVQGKKVRDDNKTLTQAGISYEDKIDSLGFTLEPNATTTLPPRCSLKETTLIPSDSQTLNKFQDIGTSDAIFLPTPLPIPTTNCIEIDRENLLHSPVDQPSFLPYELASNSKTLVPMEVVDTEALSITPIRKPRQSDIAQRRIRRPFSVSEVEALVQAVENIGTGRWRDVKLQAFDNSKHRTYVDLKDKWKTLVHTASISPQQRRGEPVPQELLDRVLSAHTFWSRQQANLPDPAHSCLPV